MSDKPTGILEALHNWLRYQVARFAIWYCTPAGLYWTDPAQWEEYLAPNMEDDDGTESV